MIEIQIVNKTHINQILCKRLFKDCDIRKARQWWANQLKQYNNSDFKMLKRY